LKRHKQSNHLSEILSTLTESKVKFIVCGGVAVVLHGVERMTVDLDIALDFSPANVKKFISAVYKLGLLPRVPVPPDALIHESQREMLIKEKGAVVFTFLDPDNPFRMIDVMLACDKSYKTLVAGSEIKRIGGQAIRIASKKQIIAMKKKVRPLREKDRFDIKALQAL
jgi:hypothetical protein